MSNGSPFTQNNPLVIRIERVNGEWTIHPSTTRPVNPANPTGPKHSDECDQRAQSKNTDIDNDWAAKRAGGAPTQPHFKRDPHTPIVVKEDDFVQFESEGLRRFVIWVQRDPDVSVDPSSPDSPFDGITLPVVCPGRSEVMQVLDDVDHQRFYKCTAWIDASGKTVVVDPDCIGI